jgi:rare lipoprotein A
MRLISPQNMSLRCSPRALAVLILIVMSVFDAGCGRKHHRTSAPAPRTPRTIPSAIAPGYTEEGIASWYGIPFNGRPAADGEIFDMETLVAAHRTLPFNTWLRVTNLQNDKSVNVRVIDRGPFVNGRILDLSKAAARDIGLLGPGIGKIRLEVISAPPDRPMNDFYAVQIGAFAVRANAEQAREKFASRFGAAYIAVKEGRTPLWRVLVGDEPSIDAARQIASVLRNENKDVFVVRLDEGIRLGNAASQKGGTATSVR